MPADARVDNVRACAFDGLGQLDNLRPDGSPFHEIQHAESVHDDEIVPNGLADSAHNLRGKAHAILVAPTPLIRPLVRALNDELIDQVALGSHDFHSVVAGFPRQGGRSRVVLNCVVHLFRGQGPRSEPADRRLDIARRDTKRMVRIPSCVENLHGDLPTGSMNRRGDVAMELHFRLGGELGREGIHPSGPVRRDAPGHHETHSSARSLGEELAHGAQALAPRGLF
mmetsp:Transcript_1677/g.7325  ORF Transcript_1677/g.7325 Transcript_1677/m.7325 type:complete len:226 (-) Transcript_1677:186-863(-)